MYLRTHKARVAGGKEVEYLYLAHNVRDEVTKKSIPKIVHAFGRADQVDREALKRLCRSIARVCGLKVRDPMAEGRKAASRRALPDGVTQVETRPLKSGVGDGGALGAFRDRRGTRSVCH